MTVLTQVSYWHFLNFKFKPFKKRLKFTFVGSGEMKMQISWKWVFMHRAKRATFGTRGYLWITYWVLSHCSPQGYLGIIRLPLSKFTIM